MVPFSDECRDVQDEPDLTMGMAQHFHASLTISDERGIPLVFDDLLNLSLTLFACNVQGY